MREPGFYWVKSPEKDEFVIAEFIGNNKWLIPGIQDWVHESYIEIDERRIVRDESNDNIDINYLISKHPELTVYSASDLLEYCHKNTIYRKMCYGDGSIMYPKWKARSE
jgi:hypothetical protein